MAAKTHGGVLQDCTSSCSLSAEPLQTVRVFGLWLMVADAHSNRVHPNSRTVLGGRFHSGRGGSMRWCLFPAVCCEKLSVGQHAATPHAMYPFAVWLLPRVRKDPMGVAVRLCGCYPAPRWSVAAAAQNTLASLSPTLRVDASGRNAARCGSSFFRGCVGERLHTAHHHLQRLSLSGSPSVAPRSGAERRCATAGRGGRRRRWRTLRTT
jgi:hypothetical protein